MLKRSLIGLVLIGVLAGVALAADPVNYFLPIYLVKGQVTSASPATIGSHVIQFASGEAVGALATPETVTSSYLLNPYEAQYFGTFPLELGSTQHKISVTTGSDGLGLSPQAVTLTDMGYLNYDITLGNVMTLVEGAVKLTVTRVNDAVNSKIRVAWEINTETYPALLPTNPVDIYYTTGNGSGEYNAAGFTTKLIENNALAAGAPGDVSLTPGNTYFEWNNQVGAGNKEIYFKGCLAGLSTDPNYGLGNAVAAGKYDVALLGLAAGQAYKYSFISSPFVVPDGSPTAVFGTQVPAGTSSSNSTQLWQWTGTAFGNQMYLHSTSGWQNVSGYSAVNSYPGTGLVFYRTSGSDEKRITLVGKVANVAFGPMQLRNSMYSFFTNPYPKQATLAIANLTATAGVYGATSSGFADQLWGWTGIAFGNQSFYSSTSTDWLAVSGYGLIDRLFPGQTYVYYKGAGAPSTGFDWGFGP